MKKPLLYLPIILSIVLFAAHFMRDGNLPIVFILSVLLVLLFVRRRWVARLTQAVLGLAAAEWLRTMVSLVQVRAALDEPYLRLVVILGAVVAMAVLAALLFQTKELRAIYRLDSQAPWPGVDP